MLRGFMTVSFWTLLSRVLGMLREVLLFALIGAGPILDAFFAAFRLPNMFRRFFAEGAFNAAFVPQFSKRLEADDRPIAFANQAMGGLTFVVLILTGFAMVFMPALVWVTANGFAGDARFDLTVDFGRVMFPYIVFISMAALLSGALNAKRHFAMAAAAPVFLNILIIFALCLAWATGADTTLLLIWTIPFAGVVQLTMVWIATHRAGLPIFMSRPRWTPEMRQLVAIAVPAALANGMVQINLLVGQLVSSQTTGAISWLYGADRLYQLPLGVVSIGIGIVLLPELSRRLKAGDHSGSATAYNRAAEISMILSLPAAAALIAIPVPLASALFEHGATGRDDILAIGLATAIYGLGLPAFNWQKLIQPVFFANEDTKTPFRFALISMLINAVLAIGLMPWLGWISAPIATTISAWAMVGMLVVASRKFGQVAILENSVASRIWRAAGASITMAVILWTVTLWLGPMISTTVLRVIYAVGLTVSGMLIYAVLAQKFGAVRMGELRRALSRRN